VGKGKSANLSAPPPVAPYWYGQRYRWELSRSRSFEAVWMRQGVTFSSNGRPGSSPDHLMVWMGKLRLQPWSSQRQRQHLTASWVERNGGSGVLIGRDKFNRCCKSFDASPLWSGPPDRSTVLDGQANEITWIGAKWSARAKI